jgi:hypothetical protein
MMIVQYVKCNMRVNKSIVEGLKHWFWQEVFVFFYTIKGSIVLVMVFEYEVKSQGRQQEACMLSGYKSRG